MRLLGSGSKKEKKMRMVTQICGFGLSSRMSPWTLLMMGHLFLILKSPCPTGPGLSDHGIRTKTKVFPSLLLEEGGMFMCVGMFYISF